MNSLNSVLLEGDLIGEPSTQLVGENQFTIFSIAVRRGEDLLDFDIVASGRLGKTCLEVLKKDRGVRVVGRLGRFDFGGTEYYIQRITRVAVYAEHVEFKPVVKPKEEE